jgi:hypothetical protein
MTAYLYLQDKRAAMLHQTVVRIRLITIFQTFINTITTEEYHLLGYDAV